MNLQVGGGKEEYQFPAARPVVGTDCGCTSVHKASLRLQNLTNQVEKRISLQTISFVGRKSDYVETEFSGKHAVWFSRGDGAFA